MVGSNILCLYTRQVGMYLDAEYESQVFIRNSVTVHADHNLTG